MCNGGLFSRIWCIYCFLVYFIYAWYYGGICRFCGLLYFIYACYCKSGDCAEGRIEVFSCQDSLYLSRNYSRRVEASADGFMDFIYHHKSRLLDST